MQFQGLKCSRCLYIEHCRGCEVTGETILRPGDNLTVSVAMVTPALVEAGTACADHASMEGLKPSGPITLLECFSAFTQRWVRLKFTSRIQPSSLTI